MKLHRPPYILVIPGDNQGCGWHRCRKPAEVLSRSGYCSTRLSMDLMDDRTVQALHPDAIVFQQRLGYLPEIERHRRLLPNAFFVYEIDDALSAVPEASWHHPYMMPDIDDRTKQAIAACDAVTCTTIDLVNHLKSFCSSGTDIRLAPNMLGKDDIEIALQMRKHVRNTMPKSERELRIGWGGGMGHAGDLALLEAAFRHFKDRIEWVFLGMMPDIAPEIPKIFVGAATADRYLATLAAMNVDLIVAPLEDHLFNRCKSNLRILESGACKYPVIASPVAPYLTDSPPIRYAQTSHDWIDSIEYFIRKSPEERERIGDKLHEWTCKNYILDNHIEERLLHWLPKKTQLFKPDLDHKSQTIITSIAESSNSDYNYANKIDPYENIESISRACYTTDHDILYIRPGAIVSAETIELLRNSEADVVAPFSNDGGIGGFPTTNSFTPIDPKTADAISKICIENPPSYISTTAVAGPVVLLRRKVLAAIGAPDFEHLSTEIAILEWAVIAKSRGMSVGYASNVYINALSPDQPKLPEIEIASYRIGNRWPQGQNDDPALKTFREQLELKAHKVCYRQLPPENRNDYTSWAEICDTAGPKNISAAIQFAEDSNLNIQFMSYSEYSPEITAPGCTIFLYPDGATPDDRAEAYISDAILNNSQSSIFYGDHDYISKENRRVSPDLKPNFDLYMALARDYLTQAVVIPSDFLLQEGVEEITEASLYRLILEFIEENGRENIIHIPRVLVHLAPLTLESANTPLPEKLRAAQEFINNTKLPISIKSHPLFAGIRMLSFSANAYKQNPHVTIIIPTKNKTEMLIPCIQTIQSVTKYKNYDILIIDNGSERPEMVEYLTSLKNADGIRIISWPHEYNWAALNNFAVQQTDSKFLLFLNDDTRVIYPEWLSEMLGAALIPDVAGVGARLVFPNGAIQHVGVAAHGGTTGHLLKGLTPGHPGPNGLAVITHEATAVTGACMCVRREVFERLGRFDESLPTNFNDVAFCRTAMNNGMVNIVANLAELQHIEGFTRNENVSQKTFKLLRDEGFRLQTLFPEEDSYWNPNLYMCLVHGGKMIAGMNLDLYAFPSQSDPWPEVDTDHILLVGPPSPLNDERSDKAAIFSLTCAGNALLVSTPPLSNCGPWDLRDPRSFKASMNLLGINKIILTKLGEFSSHILNFLLALEIPIEYRPIDAEFVCPRGNMFRPEHEGLPPSFCHDGWKRGECHQCLLTHSSPQGLVNPESWFYDWFYFTSKNCVINLEHLNPDYATSIQEYINGLSAKNQSKNRVA